MSFTSEYFTRGPGIAGDVGSLIAETRFAGGTVSTTYLHSNWRDDVVMATDTAGDIIGEYAYTTFGEPLSQTGIYTPRFGFSSKERDASGLVYYGFRYYSPVLCRWISEDPIREAGGLNLYQFCGNNPINRVDPTGYAALVVAGLFFADAGLVMQAWNDWSGLATLNQEAVYAELQSNQDTINMLKQIIASDGEMDFPDNYGPAGQMGTKLPPQGNACGDRQKVRDHFEALSNVRGYPSAAEELSFRLGTGIYNLPRDLPSPIRKELANTLLNRQNAYQNFLDRHAH